MSVAPFRTKKPAFGAEKQNYVNLYDEGILLFTIMKILGCFCLIKEEGRMKFKWLSFTTLYTIICLSISTGFSIYCFYIIFGYLITKNFNFETGILYCAFLAYPLVQFLPLLSFFESKKMATYLNDWVEFQAIFENMTRTKFNVAFHKLWYATLLCGPVFISIASFFWESNFQDLIEAYQLEPLIHLILMRGLIYLSVLVSVYGFLWFQFVVALEKAAELLICDIESFRWTSKRYLGNHKILWLNLRQLCMKMTYPLSWSLLYVSSLFFAISLPMLYIASIHAHQGNFFTLVASFNSLLFISALAELIHRAVYKVSSEFESRITALISKLSDPECQKELMTFVSTISGNPVVVTVGGFFQLDRSLNTSMYSSVITYLIIIIQFRGSSPY